jgi:hypothetical protein
MTAPDDGGAGTGCSEDDLEGFSRNMDGLLEDEDTDKSQVGKMLKYFFIYQGPSMCNSAENCGLNYPSVLTIDFRFQTNYYRLCAERAVR